MFWCGFEGGKHPFACCACNALLHGKVLVYYIRKLSHSKRLQHSHPLELRAVKVGVTHKFCTSESLQRALQVRRTETLLKEREVASLSRANYRLLHYSWHMSSSARPFLETLATLVEEDKLIDLDFSLLSNWLKKKLKGRYCHADQQARSLAVLYSNKLGEKTYSEVSSMLALPGVRQARRVRSCDSAHRHCLPE